jgi:hypothetical protein
VLDAHAGGCRNLRRILPDLIAQAGGKLRIIENADAVRVKKGRHALGMANDRKRAGYNNPVIAGKHPGNPLIVAFNKPLRHRPLANRLRLPLL